MRLFNYCLFGLGIFLLLSCTNTSQKSEIPTIDVTKIYLEKEIILQDIADVKYIPLENREDVLVTPYNRVAYISDKMIIIGNDRTGDILIFNGQGKFLRKFNHRGQSGAEYNQLARLIYDDRNKEILVVDIIFRHRIQVYDLRGKYKRTISFPKTAYYGREIIDFDSKSLLCYDELTGEIAIDEATKNPFKFVDKQTGQLLDSIALPFSKRVSPMIKTSAKGSVRPKISPIVSNGKELVLSEISCDTIFLLSKDKQLTPLVARTPKITTESIPSRIFQVSATTTQYIFANVVQLKPNGVRGYPPTNYLAIDRKTFEVSQYSLQNRDALGVAGTATKGSTRLLDAATLVEALEDGKLSGKLKEMAANLKEEDNPILMQLKFKN